MVILLFEYKNKTNQSGPTFFVKKLERPCFHVVFYGMNYLFFLLTEVYLYTSIHLNPTNDPRVLS